MRTTPEQLQQWPTEPEGTRLEFKEARVRYDFEKPLQLLRGAGQRGRRSCWARPSAGRADCNPGQHVAKNTG